MRRLVACASEGEAVVGFASDCWAWPPAVIWDIGALPFNGGFDSPLLAWPRPRDRQDLPLPVLRWASLVFMLLVLDISSLGWSQHILFVCPLLWLRLGIIITHPCDVRVSYLVNYKDTLPLNWTTFITLLKDDQRKEITLKGSMTTKDKCPLGTGPPTRQELIDHYPAKFTWEDLKTFINSGWAQVWLFLLTEIQYI